MEDKHHPLPVVGDLARQTITVNPITPVRKVVETFKQDHSLLAIPVVSDTGYVGIVSRKSLFYNHLSKPYAVELFAKAPIRELLDENDVRMESGIDINAALTRLLENDPTLDTDAFPLVDDEQYHGIVSVSDLMMKISAIQENLLAELNRLSARIREEVSCASKIQRDLLPESDCRINNQVIAAQLITSTEIGGDFYDYFSITAGKTALIVGDVSGHGLQAGMVTTAAKASLHTLAGIGLVTPTALLGGMNRAIQATAHQKLLMTCIIAIIDDEARTVTLANAGHNFPYIWKRSSGVLEMLEKAGYPLGFDNDAMYSEIFTSFEPGDLLILYTDGIVECLNPEGEEFGYGRFAEIIRREGHRSPGELRDILMEEIRAFNGGAMFDDDVTLVIAAL